MMFVRFGFCGLLVLAPLMRGSWELWSQTLVHLVSAGLVGFYVLMDRGREGSIGAGARFFLVIFLIGSLLSSSLSPFPHSALPGFLNDANSVLFFLAAAVFGSRLVPRALAVSVIPVVFLAVWNGASWLGALANQNILVAFFLLVLPFLFLEVVQGQGTNVPGTFVRMAWGLVVLGTIFCLVTGPSAVGRLGLVVEVVLAGMMIPEIRRRFSPRFTIGLLVLGAVCLMMAAIVLDPHRRAWAQAALPMVWDYPSWGVGPGAFGEAYPAFRPHLSTLHSLYAHNMFLEILAERGWVGVLSLGGVLVLLARRFCRRSFLSPAAWAAGVSIVGFLFFNTVHEGFSIPALAWGFWAVAGFLWGEIQAPASRPEASPPASPPVFPIPWSWKRAVVLVALFSFSIQSVRLFRGDQYLARARYAVSLGDRVQAAIFIEKGVFWNPREPGFYSLRQTIGKLHDDAPL
jgi:hypothetical protein